MSWLNKPVAIIEDDRVVVEQMTYILLGVSYQAARYNAYVRTRWVGCDYTGAVAKKKALIAQYPAVVPGPAGTTPYLQDINLAPAAGGQYHCICTIVTPGSWSRNEIET